MKTTAPQKESFIKVPRRLLKELAAVELQVWCAVCYNPSSKYEVTSSGIAKLLKKDRTAVVRVLNRLVEKGYIIQHGLASSNKEYTYREKPIA